ncbi:MAG: hypothetical protein ACYTG5_17425 [Planctomycetota bacterium]|jgi:hypothetical protein
MVSFRSTLILAVLSTSLAGCGLFGYGRGPSIEQREALARQEELRAKLYDFVVIFAEEVADAADEIALKSRDHHVQRRSILWKSRTIGSARLNLQRTDDLYAYLDLWSLCLQMTDFFETGAGKDMFGEFSGIALQTARDLEKRLQSMANETLADDVYERARSEIDEFAVANPMTASFSRTTMSGEADRLGEDESFSWLRTVTGVSSLNPFSTGLSEGAAAIHNVSVVADRFTSVVSNMPEDTRWQLQLLLYDLEETEPVRDLLDSINTVAESSESMAKTAEILPQRIRVEGSKLLEEFDDKQENLRKSLDKLSEASDSLRDLSASLEGSSQEIAHMAGAVDETFKTFNETITLLKGPPEDPNAPPLPGPGEPGYQRPFDILDYAKTAEAVSVTAGELTKALTEFNTTLSDERLARIEEVAEAAMEAAVWDVFLAILALIGIFFILMFSYRKLVGMPGS